MEIQNRMHDVVKLRCNACQEFLKMIILPNWQKDLYAIAYKELNSQNKDKYNNVYSRMRDTGFENYSIDDMDVTLIYLIVTFYGQLIQPVNKTTKKALQQLKDDRNIANHSSENEPSEELYLRSLLALCNLEAFIKTVDQYEVSIDDDVRLAYRQKYITEIDDLKSLIDEERISLIQWHKNIEKDIQRVLSSKNQLETWAEVNELYWNRYYDLEKNQDKYHEFIIEASNAGIKYAHVSAASVFRFIKKDDQEFEVRLKLLYDAYKELPDFESKYIVDMINDYIVNGNTITEGMLRLIDGLRNQGYLIEETEEGLFQWNKIKGC